MYVCWTASLAHPCRPHPGWRRQFLPPPRFRGTKWRGQLAIWSGTAAPISLIGPKGRWRAWPQAMRVMLMASLISRWNCPGCAVTTGSSGFRPAPPTVFAARWRARFRPGLLAHFHWRTDPKSVRPEPVEAPHFSFHSITLWRTGKSALRQAQGERLGGSMAQRPTHKNRPTGFPSRQQVLEFLETTPGLAGKREIAKAFGLKGQEKIALKKLLKDMADEGLIDGRQTAYHRMGGVPKVTVLRVVDIEDGEAIGIPDNWDAEDAATPPRLTLKERKAKGGQRIPALRRGDRVLARTEETAHGWIAHPMKKLPARSEGLMGVVEIDGSGKPWLAPIDKRIRSSSPISDLSGAEPGQLVLAERAGRSERAGVKVIEVIGDPLAPKSFSLIAIAKHGIPHVFSEETLGEARVAAALPLHPEAREDLRHLPIVAIDPADARDHDDAIWAEPDGEGGFNAVVAIADVSFYDRPPDGSGGGQLDREARKRGNSVYFPDRVVPMLPEVLSADVCSLKAGEDRAAMACHMHISPQGKVTKFRFTRAIVRIAQNIAYEDAQTAIDRGTAPQHLVDLWSCWKA